MKTILAFVFAFTMSSITYAGCTNQNIITPDGKFTYCQVCCDANNNCQTICI